MGAIFVCGQVGWFFVMERFLHFRKRQGKSELFWKTVKGKEAHLIAATVEKKSTENLADKNLLTGSFGKVVSAVAKARKGGRPAMLASAREVLAEEIPDLNKHLNTVAVLAGAAPLLGLAGTVAGIMQTFHAMTLYGAGNPSMMAGGIAQALMVTEAGLVVAFPLLICHDYLQNRADHIEDECVEGATRLIHAFEGER